MYIESLQTVKVHVHSLAALVGRFRFVCVCATLSDSRIRCALVRLFIVCVVWAYDTTGQGITSKKECLTVVVFVDRANPGIFVFSLSMDVITALSFLEQTWIMVFQLVTLHAEPYFVDGLSTLS